MLPQTKEKRASRKRGLAWRGVAWLGVARRGWRGVGWRGEGVNWGRCGRSWLGFGELAIATHPANGKVAFYRREKREARSEKRVGGCGSKGGGRSSLGVRRVEFGAPTQRYTRIGKRLRTIYMIRSVDTRVIYTRNIGEAARILVRR